METAHPNVSLKLARITARLTRAELAARIGRSPRYVRRLEHADGYAKLTPAIKEKIAAALETPIEILFEVSE